MLNKWLVLMFVVPEKMGTQPWLTSKAAPATTSKDGSSYISFVQSVLTPEAPSAVWPSMNLL